jgi:hypothetical protein
MVPSILHYAAQPIKAIRTVFLEKMQRFSIPGDAEAINRPLLCARFHSIRR